MFLMENARPEPSDMDRALLRIVSEVFERLPAGAATLTHTWSDAAGMWFVEVVPSNNSAAMLSVAFDGDDLLNFTVGNIWFEIFPIQSVDDLADAAAEVARAVFEGRVEESGFRGDAFGRLLLDNGPLGVGRIHVPWPWKARPSMRRYEPYTVQTARQP
jgi:hypothetical protein